MYKLGRLRTEWARSAHPGPGRPRGLHAGREKSSNGAQALSGGNRSKNSVRGHDHDMATVGAAEVLRAWGACAVADVGLVTIRGALCALSVCTTRATRAARVELEHPVARHVTNNRGEAARVLQVENIYRRSKTLLES
jgi:hypothetical protein